MHIQPVDLHNDQCLGKSVSIVVNFKGFVQIQFLSDLTWFILCKLISYGIK